MAPPIPFAVIPGRPEVHGHRGCRGLYPENTLPAFLQALALGVDVLEMDVVISADQQVVVSHEPWLSARLGTSPQGEEITPSHERDFNLYQLPYAAIQQCTVGEKPHPDFPEQCPMVSHRPLLNHVFQAVEAACQQLGRSPIRYAIELKSDSAGDDIFHPRPSHFVDLVLAVIRAAAVEARTTLLSFDLRILQAARFHIPLSHLCLLTEVAEPTASLLQRLGFMPGTLGHDIELLSADTVNALRAAYPALRLVPWTINDFASLKQVISWGVDGITTDYPNRLLQLLHDVNT